MPNITLSISDEIYKKMKKYSEIKWSEVVRKAIVDYLK
jgi:predicted CopG family antitoxin